MLMCSYMKHGIGKRCLDLKLAFLRDIEIADGQSRADRILRKIDHDMIDEILWIADELDLLAGLRQEALGLLCIDKLDDCLRVDLLIVQQLLECNIDILMLHRIEIHALDQNGILRTIDRKLCLRADMMILEEHAEILLRHDDREGLLHCLTTDRTGRITFSSKLLSLDAQISCLRL